MQLPSARFVRGLIFGDIGDDCRFHTPYPVIVDAGPRPSLRRLFFGDTTILMHPIAAMSGGNLAPLVPLYPNLESLRVRTGSMQLRNCEWTDDIIVALARSEILPRLRELDLSSGTPSDAGVEVLLQNRHAFAHLAKLDVSRSCLTEAASAALAALAIEVTVDDQKSAVHRDVDIAMRAAPG